MLASALPDAQFPSRVPIRDEAMMDEKPALIFEIDELSGEVVYMRPRLSDSRYLLGPKEEVLETMANFLAQEDFGDLPQTAKPE